MPIETFKEKMERLKNEQVNKIAIIDTEIKKESIKIQKTPKKSICEKCIKRHDCEEYGDERTECKGFEKKEHIPIFPKLPLSPQELDSKLRKEYNIPLSMTEKDLKNATIQNQDHKQFLLRYSHNRRDFELYYSLIR